MINQKGAEREKENMGLRTRRSHNEASATASDICGFKAA